MTAFLLFLTIVVILGFLGWTMHEAREERRQLINRIIGKTPGQVRVLDQEPQFRPPPTPPVDPETAEFWAFGEPVGGIAE